MTTELAEGYRIRPAQEGDLDRFLELISLANPDLDNEVGRAQVADFIAAGGSLPTRLGHFRLLVCESSDGELVGASMLMPAYMDWSMRLQATMPSHLRKPFQHRVCELTHLGVDAGHRGRGIGEALVRRSKGFAIRMGFRVFLAFCDASDGRLLGFYRRLGAEVLPPGAGLGFRHPAGDLTSTLLDASLTEAILFFPVPGQPGLVDVDGGKAVTGLWDGMKPSLSAAFGLGG